MALFNLHIFSQNHFDLGFYSHKNCEFWWIWDIFLPKKHHCAFINWGFFSLTPPPRFLRDFFPSRLLFLIFVQSFFPKVLSMTSVLEIFFYFHVIHCFDHLWSFLLPLQHSISDTLDILFLILVFLNTIYSINIWDFHKPSFGIFLKCFLFLLKISNFILFNFLYFVTASMLLAFFCFLKMFS